MPDELILEQEHDIPAPARRAETGRDLALWSAAVINFNGEALVCETIASIKHLEPPPSEILMVDDGSTDASVERAAEARSASTPESARALTRTTIVVCKRTTIVVCKWERCG